MLLSTAQTVCTVGSGSARAKTELAPFHNGAYARSVSDQPAPRLDHWWTGFNDPTLVTSLQLALTQHLGVGLCCALECRPPLHLLEGKKDCRRHRRWVCDG